MFVEMMQIMVHCRFITFEHKLILINSVVCGLPVLGSVI